MLLTVNSSIAQNGAVGWGGNIAVRASKSINVTLVLGRLSGGLARRGGGVSVRGKGVVLLVASHITGNSATEGGGILLSGCTLLLHNCTITGNNVSGDGGGGLVEGGGSLLSVDHLSTDMISPASYWSTWHTSSSEGSARTGAADLDSADPAFPRAHSGWMHSWGNTAGGNGGCLCVRGARLLGPLLLHHCTAGRAGGGLFIAEFGVERPLQAIISDNSARVGGGGVAVDAVSVPLRLHYVRVVGNFVLSADGRGGGLWGRFSTLLHRNCSFTKNLAAGGGNIALQAANFSMDSAISVTHTSTPAPDSAAESPAATDVEGACGGLGSPAPAHPVSLPIGYTTVSHNAVGGNAGLNSAVPSACLRGGNLLCTDACVVDGVVLRAGRAVAGGGIYVAASTNARFSRVQLWSNIASGLGGGLYTASNCQIKLAEVLVLGNTALSGGGLYLLSSAVYQMGLLVCGNKALSSGGGAVLASSTLRAALGTNTTTSNIAASDDGSGDSLGVGADLAASTDSTTGRPCIVQNNTAKGDGGGVLLLGFSLHLSDIYVVHNRATLRGSFPLPPKMLYVQ